MARRAKLSDKTQAALIKLIETGVTVADACSEVGIAESTYYNWIKRGEAGEEPFLQFLEALTRARSSARVAAIKALRNAMHPYTETRKTVEVFTETRLNKQGEPYEYVKKTESETTVRYAGDWRAALEYLKRRDPENWQPPTKIDVSWQDRAIADIRAGVVTYAALVEAFDEATANELFTRAGVVRPDG